MKRIMQNEAVQKTVLCTKVTFRAKYTPFAELTLSAK